MYLIYIYVYMYAYSIKKLKSREDSTLKVFKSRKRKKNDVLYIFPRPCTTMVTCNWIHVAEEAYGF